MRLLQEDDLRWVAGGLCKHGLYTSSEYWDIESNYYAAESAYNCAVTVLFDLDPNDPAQAAAYAAAEAQYESASDWYSSASNDYGYMEVCTDPMCDDGGNWGGQTPPPPTHYSTGGGSGNSSGDNWLTSALSAVADFLGLDGSAGYDGPEGREWAWESAMDYVEDRWDALSSVAQQAWGAVTSFATSIWDSVVNYVEETFGHLVDLFGVDGDGFTEHDTSQRSQVTSSGTPPPLVVLQIPVTQYFDGTTVERTNHFSTVEAAVKAALNLIKDDSINQNKEFAGYVTRKNDANGDYYVVEEISSGDHYRSKPQGDDDSWKGFVMAEFHTHAAPNGDGDDYPSPDDFNAVNDKDHRLRGMLLQYGDYEGYASYMMTPTGEVYKYVPSDPNSTAQNPSYYSPTNTTSGTELTAHRGTLAWDLIP